MSDHTRLEGPLSIYFWRTDGIGAWQTRETHTSEPGKASHEVLQYPENAYLTLEADNQMLRVETSRLKRDLAEARTKLDEDARMIRDLKERIWVLEHERRTSEDVELHIGVSSFQASTAVQEQFYTPSSGDRLNPVTANHARDATTPTPLQPGRMEMGYASLHHVNASTAHEMSLGGAPYLSDLASIYTNAIFDNVDLTDSGDTEQHLLSSEGSQISRDLVVSLDDAAQQHRASRRTPLAEGSTGKEKSLAGGIASVERLPEGQLPAADEYQPFLQRLHTPSPPAQLMTPLESTVERSRKRKRMWHEEPASIDRPAKRLRQVLDVVTSTEVDMDLSRPDMSDLMSSPCTTLSKQCHQAQTGAPVEAVTPAGSPISMAPPLQEVEDTTLSGLQAVILTNTVFVDSTKLVEADVDLDRHHCPHSRTLVPPAFLTHHQPPQTIHLPRR